MHREPQQSVAMNDRAWQHKVPWHALHSECYRHARPGVNPYYSTSGLMPLDSSPRGMELGEEIFDSTLARSTVKLANRIVHDVCPPGVRWADFVGSVLDDESTTQAVKRLETLRNRTFKAFHVSNGDQALHEMVLDCVCSGTGVVRVGAGREAATPLALDSSSQVEVALEAGARGAVWGYHRKFMMPREHIRAMWPDADLPPEDPQPKENARITPFMHTVYESTYYDPDAGQWWFDVVVRNGMDSSAAPMRIFEERTPISRWVGWRWSRMPGEVYGRSPVMDALPDARVASETVRQLLETASMRSGGMFTFRHGGIANPDTMRFRPGEFIEVESNDQGNPSIRPLEVGGDVNMTQLILEDLRMSITKAMLSQDMPPEGGGVRSATEWVARQKEANMAIGAPFARLVEEMLRPLLQAIVYVLSEQGVLADVGVPQGRSVRLDGTDMDLSFTSPLVRSQKLQDVQGIVEASQMAQAAAGPMGFQAAANTPRIAAKIFKLNDVDPDLSRDEDEAEEMYQQQVQAQAQAAQPPDQPGSPNPMRQLGTEETT